MYRFIYINFEDKIKPKFYNLYFAIYLLYYISLEHTSMLSYLNLPRTYVSFIFIRWSSSYGNNEERNDIYLDDKKHRT